MADLLLFDWYVEKLAEARRLGNRMDEADFLRSVARRYAFDLDGISQGLELARESQE